MAFGSDGGLYVSTAPAHDAQAGGVVRIDTDQGQTMTMSDSLLTGSACIATPTPAPTTTPASTPDATPADGTPADDGGGAGISVEIHNFAFNPTSLTVSTGTTVTWINTDSVAHTVTASDGSFDSGNIAPGDTFTFSDSGTFDYVCSYHPNMHGTIVVN